MENSAPAAGYKYLLTYQLAVVISDLTVKFCDKFLSDYKYKRTVEQVVQAARSGKQNIVEGYLEKSLKNYIYLLGISLGSYGELGEDFLDFLRHRNLTIWGKDDPQIREFRGIRVVTPNPDNPYIPDLPDNPEKASNLLYTLVSQEQYLLKKQITSLEQKFIREGGFTENLFKKRLCQRSGF